MGVAIGIIVGIIASIGIIVVGIILTSNWEWDLLGSILLIIGIVCLITSVTLGISLIGVEGDNRELFLKMQQEFIVINQYIKSNKSDSILESQDMMNRIKNYNYTIIKKQNDMTRPILKSWTKGANWNELKLIDLRELENYD